MATIKAISSKQGLKGAIDYITQKSKTEEQYIATIHCDKTRIAKDMEFTKDLWHKNGGRMYKHYALNYAPGDDITPQQALENAIKLVNETPAFQGFEIALATHTDKSYTHVHIIVNSVSYEDGHKLQVSAYDLSQLKERSDDICREQGLYITQKGFHRDGTINEDLSIYNKNEYAIFNKMHEQSKLLEKGEELNELKVESWKMNLALAVNQVKQIATSKDDFISKLESEYGIRTVWNDRRSSFTVQDDKGHRPVRNTNLSKTFKLALGKEDILDEIERNQQQFGIDIIEEPTSKDSGINGTIEFQKRADREAERASREAEQEQHRIAESERAEAERRESEERRRNETENRRVEASRSRDKGIER